MRPLSDHDLTRMETLDRMEVQGITTWAYHGVFDHERRDGQPFIVDLSWWQPMASAAEFDDLGRTADYGEVSNFVIELLQGTQVDLIETLGYQILDRLFTRFGFEYARIVLHKPDAPLDVEFDDVVLTLTMAEETGQDHLLLRASEAPTPVTLRSTASRSSGLRSAGSATRRVQNPHHRTDPHELRTCVFSLGSNIEPRLDYLQFGVTALASTPGIHHPRVSSVYETTPQSEVPQSDFLNAILIAESSLSSVELLRRSQEIEDICGRTHEISHGPRTLDIDLITVGNETSDTDILVLPHPRAALRAFVLTPWMELDPGAILSDEPVNILVSGLLDQGVRKTGDSLFLP